MVKKLRKLTKSQMLDLLIHLYVYGTIRCPFEIEDSFDRGYNAGYDDVKKMMVEIFYEHLRRYTK